MQRDREKERVRVRVSVLHHICAEEKREIRLILQQEGPTTKLIVSTNRRFIADITLMQPQLFVKKQ